MKRPTLLRALIVDDEPAARKLLVSMLEAEPAVEVVGQCQDGGQAAQWLQSRQADIVFLDVRMPQLDGFQVLEKMAPGSRPPIVFVTAYDEFALRAFSVGAWDYLLKPFDSERLGETLNRVRERLDQHPIELTSRLAEALEILAEPPIARFAVKKGKARLSVRTDDVDWIEAESNYARLHVGDDSFLTRTSLATLESKLDRRLFVRIHRSTIVNVDRVERIEAVGHGDLQIELSGGRRLQVSRRYRRQLEALLEPLA